MDEKASVTADTLELLLLNQIAIRAALEELSLWVSHRGSVHIHENVMEDLASLDTHADAISSGIENLRKRALKRFAIGEAKLNTADNELGLY